MIRQSIERVADFIVSCVLPPPTNHDGLTKNTHALAHASSDGRSGDWFYHFVESLSLALVLFSMYLLKVRFPHSYDERSDSFGNMNGACVPAYLRASLHTYTLDGGMGCGMRSRHAPNTRSTDPPTNHPTTTKTVPGEFGALLYLAVPCFVLAVIFHPGAYFCCVHNSIPPKPRSSPSPFRLDDYTTHAGLNSHFLADTTWAFSMYLESVAMLPQLYMFQKQVRTRRTHSSKLRVVPVDRLVMGGRRPMARKHGTTYLSLTPHPPTPQPHSRARWWRC